MDDAVPIPSGGLKKYLSVLAHRNFRLLWLAQVCAKLSENFLNFALVILLFQVTNSTFLVSVLVALVSIPPILFSAGAGVFADSYNRKKIMLATNFLRLLLVVPVLVSWQEPSFLLGSAFVLAVFAQFFSPAEVASIPTLVPKEQLFTANAFYQFTGYAAFLLGYSLAGPSLHRLGEGSTLLISLGLYALAVILVAFLPNLNAHLLKLSQIELAVHRSYRQFWQRLLEGVRFIRQHPVVLFIIIQVGVLFAIEKSFISLAPSFSQNLLRFNVEELSLFLIVPTGIGAFVGAIVANAVRGKFQKDHLISFGMVLDGIALFFLAFITQIVDFGVGLGLSAAVALKTFVVMMAFLSGFADPFIIISAQTAIHELVPNEDRGRVFGVLYTVINTMSIVPVLIIGALTTRGIAIQAIVVGLGLVILAAAVIGVVYYRGHHLGREAPTTPSLIAPDRVGAARDTPSRNKFGTGSRAGGDV
ncbi:MAG: MFS transporter [Candidatus Kerfeldbacteria bacterium]|nr:MFS transporter [Candidatus Kerfeldbacteria bacterium]